MTTFYNSIIVGEVKLGEPNQTPASALAYNTMSHYTYCWINGYDEDAYNCGYDASKQLFVDAENGDYRLAAGSQAIDKGNDAYAVDASGAKLTTDLAGENRFVGTVDLGAYELQAQGVEAPGEIVFGAYDVATKKLEMSWGASKNAAKYRVEYSRDGGKTWNNSGVVAANVTSRVATLGYKSAYQFRVRAENANDVSDWVYGSFNPATDARPTAPGTEIKFGSYDAETGKVKMSWSAASNEARYRIEYSRDGGKTWNNSGAVDSGVTSRTATLSYRTSVYHFRVCAENAAGASDWVYGVFDPLSSAQPTAPGNKISFGAYDMATGKIEMSWKDSTGEDYYRVEYSRDGGKTWNNSGVLDANVTSRVATLGYKSEYSFRIRAVNANGLSKWVYGTINPVANLAPTTPGAQITFGAYDASTGKVEMSWSAAENATRYRVEFSRNGGQTWNNSGVFGSNVTSRLATLSVKNAVYQFRVRAENAVGVSDWVYGVFDPAADASSVASSVVSEAFADYFAEEGADDEFWFEFEKALG
ncbi:MAG: fibronectin type III domain-containing protein, partial [Thermoguttaceae bacterium]|nr:fibronectin type III domain-containing protein [Thermoguttaceae bacterium]